MQRLLLCIGQSPEHDPTRAVVPAETTNGHSVQRLRSRSSTSGTGRAPVPAACPGFWVSVSAASIFVVFSGVFRLGGLRSRACRRSRGHRPTGSDTGAKGRRATLPQRHRSGVGGSLTRTPLRRACRLQRPCSLPIVRAYFGSASPRSALTTSPAFASLLSDAPTVPALMPVSANRDLARPSRVSDS
jgi:hypothetical protein